MLFKFLYPKETKKEVLKQKLLWYDTFYKKMKEFHTSLLKYKQIKELYIELEDGSRIPLSEASKEQKKKYETKSEYRIIAEPIECIKKEVDYINNKKVEKWFEDYHKYNNSESEIIERNKDGILINIPDKEMDDVLYDAERHNIRFEKD
jgi:hypothetical protein